MKYLALLLVFSVCLSCDSEAEEFQQVLDEANAEDIEAAVEVLEVDVSVFKVKIQTNEVDEDLVDYFRSDRLILVKNKDVYRLCQDGVPFGRVVVNKDWSPKILIDPDLNFHVILTPLDSGGWELAAHGSDPELLEVFIITQDSVSPVGPHRYLELLALSKGSQAAFDSLGESLLENLEDNEQEASE